MKKFIISVLLLTMFVGLFSINSADAAKKGGKKKGISAEEMTNISTSVDSLTMKLYTNALFSPQDMNSMSEIKLKLDDQMLISVDPELAPLYYKMGNIFKAREYKEEAISCFQTILENFSSTAFCPKAKKELDNMGVTIKVPTSSIEFSGEPKLRKLDSSDEVEVIKLI